MMGVYRWQILREPFTVFISFALWYCLYHMETQNRGVEKMMLSLTILQTALCRVHSQIMTSATLLSLWKETVAASTFLRLWI